MAHVEIKPNPKGGYHLLVDGTDIGRSVLHDGFHIQPGATGFEVAVVIAANTLEADLPEAVVNAFRAEADHV